MFNLVLVLTTATALFAAVAAGAAWATVRQARKAQEDAVLAERIRRLEELAELVTQHGDERGETLRAALRRIDAIVAVLGRAAFPASAELAQWQPAEVVADKVAAGKAEIDVALAVAQRQRSKLARRWWQHRP